MPSKIVRSSDLIFVGEGPGLNEVKLGEPFVGQSGQLLHFVVENFTEEEFSKTNVVACRPPGNRDPTEKEIECCRGRLELDLAEASPKTIVALGKSAADYFTGTGMKISERRGLWFSDNGRDILCTWHPAYVLRRPGEMNTFVTDVRKAVAGRKDVQIPDPGVTMPKDHHELKEALERIEGPNVVFDLETDQLQWYKSEDHPQNHILMLGITDRENNAIIVNHDLLYGSGGDEYYFNRTNAYFEDQRDYMMASSASEAREILQEFFNRKDLAFIAHNGKFDVVFLRTVGIEARTDFDTMLAHYVLFEESTHGLKGLLVDYFGIPDYEKNLVQVHLRSRNDYYSKVPMWLLAKYCAIDVCMTLKLAHKLHEDLVRDDLHEQPFMSPIMEAQKAFVDMEWRGVGVDVPYVHMWQGKINDYLNTIESEMSTVVYEELAEIVTQDEVRFDDLLKKARNTVKTVRAMLLGEIPFNPRSSYMMSFAMYEVFKLPRPRARNIKATSTSKDAVINILERYPNLKDNVLIVSLKKYRRAHKMQRSYIKNILESVDVAGSVHPTFLVHGTEVGRLSARNPAVQTIPRPYEDIFGAIIRSAFIARPGYVFVDADYSQAELRVAACLSMDEFLLEVYNDERDLHTEVAQSMYGSNWTKEQRVLSKMFNFSYLYGGNEYSFAQDAGLPLNTARKFVHDYNKLMWGLAEWKAKQFEMAKTRGYVESRFGRRRRFPLITRENLEEVRKASVHMPVASAASDLNLLSLIRLINEGYRVCLTVHDSIITEVPQEKARQHAEYIKQVMIETASEYFPWIPWKVDADIVSRWSPYPVQAPVAAEDWKYEQLPTIIESPTGVKEFDKLVELYGKVQLWPEEIA